jgi:diguanylate cyclase (GGDEF)-like protein/PAS domain S-box-containing protein
MSVRVLLITRFRDLIRRIAASNGDALAIEHVAWLSDAKKRLKQHAFQAIMADLDLPDAQGMEALRALTRAAPQVPIVVLGDDTESQYVTMMEHGAEDYLLKSSLSGETLVLAVRGAIARKSREAGLFIDRERAQVTLDSIGDAVLSTDGAGRIDFLNPVAEKLMGWTFAEASGRHLSEVFQVIDAATRKRIVPRLEFEVKNGRTMILPPNCVLVHRNGRESPIEDSAAPIHDRADHIAGMVVVFHDVSDVRAMTQKMTHLAEHDVLTSLPNRAVLDDRLEQCIALGKRHSRRLGVLFVDLDRFKHINDSVGHLIGDQILIAVSQRIGLCLRNSDTVSRQGGDEFIVLLSEIQLAEDASLIAEKIRLAVLEPYTIADHYLHLSASIGVSVYPNDGEDAETLIRCADTAMYHAKERGRNNSQFFKEEMNVRATERQIITSDLRDALRRGEFMLEYQPKIDLFNGAITGIEALIRWRHPSRGVLLPLHFIPIAEDCGLIIQIGQWALRAACIQAQMWVVAGLKFGTMAVNISAVEFRSDRFFEGVCGILQSTGLEARYLELELTETAVMRNFEATCIVLQALSAMGVRIAVDDYGTGYSNLSYLTRFPINTLKLDRSFIHDVPGSANAATIVSSVIQMGRGLKLQVVAEGVENVPQLNFLRANNCGEGQGYYFSEPVNSVECQSLLSIEELHWARQFRSLPAMRAFK